MPPAGYSCIMTRLVLVALLCAGCSDSHPGGGAFGGEPSNAQRPSGVGGAADATGVQERDGGAPLDSDGGTVSGEGVDDAEPVAGEGPLTQAEVLDACSDACAHVDACGGPSLLQCVDGCIKLGATDVSPECDAEVRALVRCVLDLECAQLEGDEIELDRTRCGGHVEILRQDCGLG